FVPTRSGPRRGQLGNLHRRSRNASVFADSVLQLPGCVCVSSLSVNVVVSIRLTSNFDEPKIVAVTMPLSLLAGQLVLTVFGCTSMLTTMPVSVVSLPVVISTTFWTFTVHCAAAFGSNESE